MIWQSDSPTRMALELEWKEEENAKLREENARLRAALRGLFKPDSIPYAQWAREMHAAHIALERE